MTGLHVVNGNGSVSCAPPNPCGHCDHCADDTDDTEPANPKAADQPWVKLTPASSVKMDRPRWVWDRRIPVGGTTLMAGREGLGKTMLVIHLAAMLSRGELAGQWEGKPARVIYVGLEDDRSTVTVPRLVAAGADLDRFLFADIPSGGTFSVNVDLDSLLAAAKGQDVALVVLDPLDSHLGSVDTHRKSEVQAAVGRLAVLAQELRCGALGLGHINKGDARDLLPRVVGSVGFTTSVRSVLGVGKHPEREDERVCVLGKANMTADDVPAIRFAVESAVVDHPDDPFGIPTGRVVILGEESGLDPNAIIATSTEDRSALDEAVEWLEGVLGSEPMPRAEIVKLARGESISLATLKRAADRVGVEVTRNENERGRPSLWALKGFSSPPFEPKPYEPKPEPSLSSANSSDELVSAHVSGSEPKPIQVATERDSDPLGPVPDEGMF